MLEFYQFIILEMDAKVEAFCEQPYKIEGFFNGKKKNSVFDFGVKYKDGCEEFQEVKSTSDLTGDDKSAIRAQEQITFQKEWCKNNGYNYRVITEEDIFDGSNYLSFVQLTGVDAETILSDGLLSGMSVIGEKFKNAEIYIPEVLVAARTMNVGTELLKPILSANGVVAKDLMLGIDLKEGYGWKKEDVKEQVLFFDTNELLYNKRKFTHG